MKLAGFKDGFEEVCSNLQLRDTFVPEGLAPRDSRGAPDIWDGLSWTVLYIMRFTLYAGCLWI